METATIIDFNQYLTANRPKTQAAFDQKSSEELAKAIELLILRLREWNPIK